MQAGAGWRHTRARWFWELKPILAREHIKGNLVLSLESPEYRMSRIAMDEMFLGGARAPEEALRLVDAVTPDAVRELAAALLPQDRFVLAAAGDLPAGPELAF